MELTTFELTRLAAGLPSGSAQERVEEIQQIWDAAVKLLHPPLPPPHFENFPSFDTMLRYLMPGMDAAYRREARFEKFMRWREGDQVSQGASLSSEMVDRAVREKTEQYKQGVVVTAEIVVEQFKKWDALWGTPSRTKKSIKAGL